MDESKKREFTNAAKIVVGGISAAVAFEIVQRATPPTANLPELFLLAGAAVIAIVVLTIVTWIYFLLLERDAPSEEVDLTTDALDDIVNRLAESEGDDDG